MCKSQTIMNRKELREYVMDTSDQHQNDFSMTD